MDELGRLIVNLCNVVPDGIVCFWPSYAYEDKVFQYWQEQGVIKRIEQKKKVNSSLPCTQLLLQFMRESRSSNVKVEETLRQYQQYVESSYPGSGCQYKGALLSCIVGGKLSEGINFSDGLGRCIVMVGLPYPNKNDPILQEKMNYITKHTADPNAGNEYYENVCMRAVNQSIGK